VLDSQLFRLLFHDYIYRGVAAQAHILWCPLSQGRISAQRFQCSGHVCRHYFAHFNFPADSYVRLSKINIRKNINLTFISSIQGLYSQSKEKNLTKLRCCQCSKYCVFLECCVPCAPSTEPKASNTSSTVSSLPLRLSATFSLSPFYLCSCFPV